MTPKSIVLESIPTAVCAKVKGFDYDYFKVFRDSTRRSQVSDGRTAATAWDNARQYLERSKQFPLAPHPP